MLIGVWCLRLYLLAALPSSTQGYPSSKVVENGTFVTTELDESAEYVRAMFTEDDEQMTGEEFQETTTEIPDFGNDEDNMEEASRAGILTTQERVSHLSDHRIPMVFCNFNAEATERKGTARFTIQNARATFCTDFNYEHANIQDYHLMSVSRLDVMPHSRNLFLPRYTVLNDLKVAIPSLKTFLTVTESESITFSDIVLDTARNMAFVSSCVYNLRLWGFNGLIVKWLYPAVPEHLTRLLVDLRNAFDMDFRSQRKGIETLLLGVALTGQNDVAEDLYQVFAISSLVDIIILQMFDETPVFNITTRLTCSLHDDNIINPGGQKTTPVSLHTSTATPQSTTTTPATTSEDMNKTLNKIKNIKPFPLISGDEVSLTNWPSNASRDFQSRLADESNSSSMNQAGVEVRPTFEAVIDPAVDRQFVIEKTITEWLSLGAHTSQLVIGLSLIGQAYLLKDKAQHDLGAPTTGPAPPEASDVPGQVFFYEMCKSKKGGTVKRLSGNDHTPYWYNDTVWISYEDMTSLTQKVEYLRDVHIVGVMLFSQSEDDFTGNNCGLGMFPASGMIYNISKAYLASYAPAGVPEWHSYCNDATTMSEITSLVLIIVVCFRYIHL